MTKYHDPVPVLSVHQVYAKWDERKASAAAHLLFMPMSWDNVNGTARHSRFSAGLATAQRCANGPQSRDRDRDQAKNMLSRLCSWTKCN